MAKVVSELVTAPSGTVYVAPVGTAAPADEAAALNAAWLDLGYVTEDGATFRVSHEEEESRAWQSKFPLRRKITSRDAQLSFVLEQWDKVTIPLAFGGGTVTVVSAGHYKYAPPVSSAGQDERAMLLEWADGTKVYRIVIPKVAVDPGARETQVSRSSDAVLPLTFNVNGSDASDAFYMLTNDPAFA